MKDFFYDSLSSYMFGKENLFSKYMMRYERWS